MGRPVGRLPCTTALARAGVTPKVARSLARHATPTLAFDVDAKLGADDERKALEVLPDHDTTTTSELLRATGADLEAENGPERVASGCPPLQSDTRSSMLERGPEWRNRQTRWIQNPFPARE